MAFTRTKMAGTTGRSLRLEGIKINLDLNGYTGGIEYRTHVQNVGWTGDNGNVPQRDLYIEVNENRPLHFKANWAKQ